MSKGRLTLGFGLGVDTSGELSKFDEVVDPRLRGEMLDEGVPVLAALLAGETVQHRGEHVVVDDVLLGPRSPQGDRPPFWFAARARAQAAPKGELLRGGVPARDGRRPLRPAHRDRRRERGGLNDFDIALSTTPGEPVADYA